MTVKKSSNPKMGKNIYKITQSKHIPDIKFFDSKVPAGFPSPAEDFEAEKIDLNKFLVKHQASTFLVRVRGFSMVKCGISDGDILIVDRSIDPKDNSIILAVLDGEFTVKRVKVKEKELFLVPENPDFDIIKIEEEMNFEVWGTVIHVIKSFK